MPGLAATAGSKVGFVAKTGRVIVKEDCRRSGEWRKTVAICARARNGYRGPMIDGPIAVVVSFHMPRPKKHYRTGRYADLLKDSAPTHHLYRPDATKLWRCAEDALTGVIWSDDAQIVEQTITKVYATGLGPGMEIQIWRVDT